MFGGLAMSAIDSDSSWYVHDGTGELFYMDDAEAALTQGEILDCVGDAKAAATYLRDRKEIYIDTDKPKLIAQLTELKAQRKVIPIIPQKAWSYSALSAFETCPRQFYEVRVAKSIPYVQSAPAAWGDEVHKALENYAKNGTVIPNNMAMYKPIVDKILALPGADLIEKELPIKGNFSPAGWWDKDVWCRGKADIGKLNGTKLFLGDYKTGKQKDDFDQMALFAALGMHWYAAVEEVRVAYLWLVPNTITSKVYRREDLPEIWNNYLPRIERFNAAHHEQAWPEKPSGLCRKWCPVTKCKYNGV